MNSFYTGPKVKISGKLCFVNRPFEQIIMLGIIILLALPSSLQSQQIISLETKWNDSFKEWVIYTEGDSIEGSIELSWPLNNDWTSWTFELGDLDGRAKLKYGNDPNLWEFRAGNEIVTAKTIWSNDFSKWRFTDGHYIIELKTKYRNMPIIWFTEGERYGYIDIYMEYEEDPSFWIIEDFLEPEISPLYRMALIFISIHHATPKY